MSIIKQFYCPEGQSYTKSELSFLHLLDIREDFQYVVLRIRSKLGMPIDGFNSENYQELTDKTLDQVMSGANLLANIYSLPHNWVTTFYFIILFGFSIPPKWSPIEKTIKVFDCSYTTNDQCIIELFGMVKTEDHLKHLLSVIPKAPNIRVDEKTIENMRILFPLIKANKSVEEIADFIQENRELVSIPVFDEDIVDSAKLNVYITRFKKYQKLITESYPNLGERIFPAVYRLAFTRFILQYS